MSPFLSFFGVLEIIYFIAKISGFVFVSIDLKTYKIVESNWNAVIFLISFVFSLIANLFISSLYLNIASVTQSKLMELGVNSIVRAIIYVACILKLINAAYSQTFCEIFFNMHYCEMKVSAMIRKWKSYENFLI